MKTLLLLIASISLFSQGVTTIPGGVGKTSNNVILRGSGNTLPALCTVGQQFFKTNATAGQNLYGCTATNTWTLLGDGAGSNGMTLVQQVSASNSATLSLTSCISSTYDNYIVTIQGLIPSTNATAIWLRVSTDGGSSYDSASNYRWTALRWSHAGTANTGSTADGKIVLTAGETASNNSNYGLSGAIMIFDAGSTSVYKRLNFAHSQVFSSGGEQVSMDVGGTYMSLTAINAFQFLSSSGNLSSGTVRCYGLAKS